MLTIVDNNVINLDDYRNKYSEWLIRCDHCYFEWMAKIYKETKLVECTYCHKFTSVMHIHDRG